MDKVFVHRVIKTVTVYPGYFDTQKDLAASRVWAILTENQADMKNRAILAAQPSKSTKPTDSKPRAGNVNRLLSKPYDPKDFYQGQCCCGQY